MAKADWLKYGMANGGNDDAMDALVEFLPEDAVDENNYHRWELSIKAMAELWLRGVTKEEFLAKRRDKLGVVAESG